MSEDNGWSKWQVHVLSELKRLSTDIQEHTRSHKALVETVIILKERSKIKDGVFVIVLTLICNLALVLLEKFI